MKDMGEQMERREYVSLAFWASRRALTRGEPIEGQPETPSLEPEDDEYAMIVEFNVGSGQESIPEAA